MKSVHLHRIFLAGALCFCCLIAGCESSRGLASDQFARGATRVSVDTSANYTSDMHDCGIWFPQVPGINAGAHQSTARRETFTVATDSNGVKYSLSAIPIESKEREQVGDTILSTRSGVSSSQWQPVGLQSKDLMLDGYPGRELTFDVGAGALLGQGVIARYYYSGYWLYEIMVQAPKATLTAEKENVDRFLNSFTIEERPTDS